jgi:hypothetical protein
MSLAAQPVRAAAAPNAPASINGRLSLMMFLEFFAWGSWYATVAVYMARVGMQDLTHWPFTVNPIAAIVAPFFLGFVADRFFPTERVLGVLHLLAAGTMLLVPRAADNPTLFIVAPARLQPVLHAHARAVELARLRAHPRPGARVPARARVRDARGGSRRGCSCRSC